MIVASAIRTKDGKVWVAARHPHVFAVIAAQACNFNYGYSRTPLQDAAWREYTRDWVQGFVTAGGDFLDREQSMAHVLETKQFMTPRRAEHPNAILTSEDLW